MKDVLTMSEEQSNFVHALYIVGGTVFVGSFFFGSVGFLLFGTITAVVGGLTHLMLRSRNVMKRNDYLEALPQLLTQKFQGGGDIPEIIADSGFLGLSGEGRITVRKGSYADEYSEEDVRLSSKFQVFRIRKHEKIKITPLSEDGLVTAKY